MSRGTADDDARAVARSAPKINSVGSLEVALLQMVLTVVLITRNNSLHNVVSLLLVAK